MEKALEHLSKTYPLRLADLGGVVRRPMQPAKLAGRWAVSRVTRPGKGAIVGQVVVSADPNAPDSFNIDTHYTVARTRRSRHARRESDRLHRIPVARARRHARQRQRLARSR